MVEHGTVTADVSALVVVILVVCVLSLITRWVFKPSRPRTGPVVDATESTDLGMLDVLAADLSRAMRCRYVRCWGMREFARPSRGGATGTSMCWYSVTICPGPGSYFA